MLVNSRKHDNNLLQERLVGVLPAVKKLYTAGLPIDDWLRLPKVAIVGSRKYSAYGQAVTRQIISELVPYNVVIISGLALGTDSIAHRAALEAGGTTVAVLPGGLGSIYPAAHTALARQIVGQGSLVTEYEAAERPRKYHFIARNRLISALSDAVLIPEAAKRSGSLHTAQFALEQGRTVLAVPGDITRGSSQGTNNLIKQGAIAVTETADILMALGINPAQQQTLLPTLSANEQLIISLLKEGTQEAYQLQRAGELEASLFFSVMTGLELKGFIKSVDGSRWISRL